MTWTSDPLQPRRAEREALLESARVYATDLGGRLPLSAVVVAGSVARGDFNVWSDVDVVVVSDALPADAVARAAALHPEPVARVQAVGYTNDEFLRALDRGDALAQEAAAIGVLVHGHLPVG